MKKFFLIVFLFFLTTHIATAKPDTALGKQVNINSENNNFIKLNINSPEYNNLLVFINNYDCYMNSHNEKELRKLYSEDYINADGINLNSFFKLLNDTWKAFPDIKFVSQVQAVH
ncbi:MAG: hypothetical protein WC197_04955 [Candidatus Gastranaerophilaceae bacterium]|jgi:UDP-N-acetyl-D-mannosaminuronic acid transferase (WecB/TagA/CpsF family)